MENNNESAIYELRLSLYDMIRVAKGVIENRGTILTARKRVEAAEGILKKHFKITDILRHQQPQPGPRWVKASIKPEHNVGVLVFIPGEDNHITSGMWDIDNKWVLLDEYRISEEEVTHWMPLPSFPEGYPANELPDEIGAMIKEIAREELGRKEQPAAGREEDAVAFLAWIQKNDYYYSTHGGGYWYEWNEKEQETFLCNTNDELYKLFKQQKY